MEKKEDTPKNPAGEFEQPIDAVPLYRKKRVVIPLFIAVIVALGALWYWYTNMHGIVYTDDANIDANRVTISSKILGRIARLTVDEGAAVTKGDPLVYLDDTDLKSQEKQSTAALSQAEKEIVLTQVNWDKAKNDYDRRDELYKGGSISKEQYDNALKAVEASKAQYDIALAKRDVSQAQLEVIQTQLKNTIIVSPISGVMAKRWALAGDVVQPGQAIFAVYDVVHLWVTANLEETKLSNVKMGSEVEIFVDTYPNLVFRGKVTQLGTNTAAQFSLIPPSNASGNFTKVTQRVPIKTSIEYGDSNGNPVATPLLPGMSVEIKIKVQ